MRGKNWLVAIMSIVIIYGAAFYFQYISNLEKMRVEADKAVYSLGQTVHLSSRYIELLALVCDNFYEKNMQYDNKLIDMLEEAVDGKSYSIPASQEEKFGGHIGSMTGVGLIPASGERRRDIDMAMSLNPYFVSIFDTLPDITWVYYTSTYGFINIYPFIPADEFAFSEDLYKKEFYQVAIPENNPSRSKQWTSVYVDAAGKGEMVTISEPIYYNDEFKGVVSIDFTLAYLNKLIESDYTSLFLNKDYQVLAASKAEGLDKDMVFLKDIENIPSQKTILMDGRYVYISQMADEETHLKLVFAQSADRLIMDTLIKSFPLLVMLLMILGIYIQMKKTKNYSRELRKMVNELELSQNSMHNASVTDYLTCIPNRRGIYEVLVKEIDRYKRYQRPFVVIICDIDDFKKVNDIYGHETGDEMLRFLSAKIVENIRSADYFGRWGGEEFLLLLPETTYQQGMLMAEGLRKVVEGATFPTELGPLQKTMTFGLSEYDSSLTIEETISRADRSLLQGKAAGKNRVVGFCEIDPDQYFCKEERAEDGSQPEMS